MSSLVAGPTIGQILVSANGFTRGFDIMRIALAVVVLCWHSIYASYGSDSAIWAGPFRPLPSLILPMFFALSGFLVAGSLARCTSLIDFFSLRAIRLVPALFFEVMLSALILGLLVTQVSASDYLTSPVFYSYWLNTVGHIHYYLPGVFLDNPVPGIVNVSLWTVPYELDCYILLGILAVCGIATRARLLLMTFAALSIAAPLWEIVVKGGGEWGRPTGKLLVLSFIAGLLLYAGRDRIPVTRGLFGVCGALSLVFLARPDTAYLAPFPVAYVTVFMGLTNPPQLPVISSGDYSYGLYLYAFPMQQTFCWLFTEYRVWWLNILFALPTSFACAVFSWHLIEKPILRHKKVITTAVRGFLEARARQVAHYLPALMAIGRLLPTRNPERNS